MLKATVFVVGAVLLSSSLFLFHLFSYRPIPYLPHQWKTLADLYSVELAG